MSSDDTKQKQGACMSNVPLTSGPGVGRLKVPSLFVLSLLLSACICGREAKPTEQFAIDYPAPSFSGLTAVKEELRVERFTVARAYRGHGMVYSPGGYREETYNYNRWIVSPGDMVGDHIVRDLRKSGLFGAVYSWCDREEPEFALEGTVEKFLESDRGDNVSAVIDLNVILLDRKGSGEGKVVFQKTYHASEPMQKKTPRSMAEGLSSAAAKVSEQVIRDVYEGIRNTRNSF